MRERERENRRHAHLVVSTGEDGVVGLFNVQVPVKVGPLRVGNVPRPLTCEREGKGCGCGGVVGGIGRALQRHVATARDLVQGRTSRSNRALPKRVADANL